MEMNLYCTATVLADVFSHEVPSGESSQTKGLFLTSQVYLNILFLPLEQTEESVLLNVCVNR